VIVGNGCCDSAVVCVTTRTDGGAGGFCGGTVDYLTGTSGRGGCLTRMTAGLGGGVGDELIVAPQQRLVGFEGPSTTAGSRRV